MKKPVDDYIVEYPENESESESSYYGDCETNNYSCNARNYAGNGNGNSW